jgi:hypothetical protein
MIFLNIINTDAKIKLNEIKGFFAVAGERTSSTYRIAPTSAIDDSPRT